MSRVKRFSLVSAVLLVLISLSPYILLWGNGRYMDWDNLDSVHVWYKTLLESGHLFSSNTTIVESMMGGLPRSSFPSEFSLTTLLYAIAGPLGSYVIERIIALTFAFAGMYLFLNKYMLAKRDAYYIVLGVATLFAILPFWPYGGLSVAGIPLLVYCFLRFRDGDARWPHWLYIIFNPFASSLVLSGIFVIVVVFFYAVIVSIKARSPGRSLFAALFAFIVASVLANYRLFIAFLVDSAYVSHRIEFAEEHLNTLSEAARVSLGMFVTGQDHAHSLHFPIIIATVFLALILSINRGQEKTPFLWGFLFVILVSVLYGAKGAHFFSPIHTAIVQKVPIQYDRFYFLLPFTWYALFAYSLYVISSSLRLGRFVSGVAIIAQSFILLSMNQPLRAEVNCRLRNNCSVPTYNQFYAQQQFAEIRQFIGKPADSYRVVSIGIHPSISSYNGFHTLDGYSADYPLSYKKSFRKIIAKELEKNPRKRIYFDLWGSRAYVFTEQDFGNMAAKWSATPDRVVKNLQLNTVDLSRLGGSYIISSIPIELSSSPGLRLLRSFKHPDSAWDIWLYQVAGSGQRG